MKGKGVIISIDNNIMKVQIGKHEGCGHCDRCSEGAAPTIEKFEKPAGLDVKTGDTIGFEIDDSKVLKAGIILYIIPVVTFFAGFYAGYKLFGNEAAGIIGSFAGLAAGFIGIAVYDKVRGKKEFSNVKITKESGGVCGG